MSGKIRSTAMALAIAFLGLLGSAGTASAASGAVKVAKSDKLGSYLTDSKGMTLYTFKNETVGGLTPPLSYTRGKPAFITCWYPQEIQSGKFTPLTSGAKPDCITPAALAQVQQLLAGV